MTTFWCDQQPYESPEAYAVSRRLKCGDTFKLLVCDEAGASVKGFLVTAAPELVLVGNYTIKPYEKV